MARKIGCRACGAPLHRTVIDFGVQPLSNALIPLDRAEEGETVYPLHVRVCDACFLVQLPELARREDIFNADYVYFSSYSTSWLEHARRYAQAMVARFGLTPASHVAEVASNDGYLLRNFVPLGMTVTGIEPATACAEAARAVGVHSETVFFGIDSARAIRAARGAADLVAANNVLAHVPDLDDFVGGFREILKPEGVATFEFPHLLNQIRFNQFDTIYHEHFSYLSLSPLHRVFARHGLRIFDVEALPTHGGSLRLFVCHDAAAHAPTPAVAAVREEERAAGLETPGGLDAFAGRVCAIKEDVMAFLAAERRAGRSVVGYGAAAKGNTLINYCGIGRQHMAYVVDRNPAKLDRLLPGSRIPVLPVDTIERMRPDVVFILPWNLRDEITEQLAFIRQWGGRFATAIPGLSVD
ncbi:class I SAM-dependent methyltransferase [Alsobacter sp. R-9]